MTPPDLAGIIERDAQWDDVSPDALPSPIADRRALLGLLRETREALLWTLRNNGGECPADHPAGYVKAMRAALALSALAEP